MKVLFRTKGRSGVKKISDIKRISGTIMESEEHPELPVIFSTSTEFELKPENQ